MKNKGVGNWGIAPTWLKVTIALALVLGLFFRFFNLDRKVYWIDETYTSLRISGLTEAELVQEVFDGRATGLEELAKLQRPNPETGLTGTLNSLKESPQHPPLYFVMARFWMQWFGDFIATPRSLSAIISLLAFPCLYWLCLELFGSPATGWVALALLAVSPFHVLYAQEARQYSLWAVTVLLSSAALLGAIRRQTALSWGIYAASLALSFYTFLFSLFVAVGHGIYVAISEGCRWEEPGTPTPSPLAGRGSEKESKTLIAYLLSSLAAVVAFAPWLLVIAAHSTEVESTADWTSKKVAFGFLLQRWLINFSNVFFDLNLGYKYLNPAAIAILIIAAYSIYFLCRHTPKQVWLFVVTLIGVTALPLMVPDVISGGLRSATARYLTPCYLGVQLAVANLLATQGNFGFWILDFGLREREKKGLFAPEEISLVSDKSKILSESRRRRMWRLVAVALIAGGVLSCAVSSQAQFWWNKSPSKNQYNPQIAEIVNRAEKPLLISDSSRALGDCFACRILGLSYLLDPKVKLLLVVEPNIPKIPDGFSDVFLFSPSDGLRAGLERERNCKTQLVFQRHNFWLWKVVKS
ncbi:MAG: glycosyltransferase family 39 protein [Oscillatoria princeps RMCB-10]|jgi:uncharacterized membrane protein|nr:glycosyltransferase family 39 protein [Oscillatoria princeps RMCB-10]